MGIREFPSGAPRGKSIAVGMRRSPDVSPRRLSDISPQLRQLKYLVVDEAIKEDLKWSRSVEDLTSGPVGLTSIEERILRITGYYGYQPWAASCKSKTPSGHFPRPQVRLVTIVTAASGSACSEASSHPLPPCLLIQTQVCNFEEEAWRRSSPGPLRLSDAFSYTPSSPTHRISLYPYPSTSKCWGHSYVADRGKQIRNSEYPGQCSFPADQKVSQGPGSGLTRLSWRY
ncbi:uncharacterized protein LOC144338038 [Macaca mulatta]